MAKFSMDWVRGHCLANSNEWRTLLHHSGESAKNGKCKVKVGRAAPATKFLVLTNDLLFVCAAPFQSGAPAELVCDLAEMELIQQGANAMAYSTIVFYKGRCAGQHGFLLRHLSEIDNSVATDVALLEASRCNQPTKSSRVQLTRSGLCSWGDPLRAAFAAIHFGELRERFESAHKVSRTMALVSSWELLSLVWR